MDTIIEEFKDKAIMHGEIYTFKSSDAIAIIQRCRKLGHKVYGIDAFEIKEPYIQPMDYSDYTGDAYKNYDPEKYYQKYHAKKNFDLGHWEEAIQFIKDRSNEGWYFEVVYE